ncbi:Otoferlin [Manis pentadactyla]|nr:Otoferlin [Manis pentadactyla]
MDVHTITAWERCTVYSGMIHSREQYEAEYVLNKCTPSDRDKPISRVFVLVESELLAKDEQEQSDLRFPALVQAYSWPSGGSRAGITDLHPYVNGRIRAESATAFQLPCMSPLGYFLKVNVHIWYLVVKCNKLGAYKVLRTWLVLYELTCVYSWQTKADLKSHLFSSYRPLRRSKPITRNALWKVAKSSGFAQQQVAISFMQVSSPEPFKLVPLFDYQRADGRSDVQRK